MASIDDHHRPQYHFSPPANWMNDPNGLVYYQGEYHLFYQYHPGSSVWGPMHWGHAVSTDLVNWQHLPIALYPDEKGTIFSGCALIDWENTAGFGKEAMVAVFTHDRADHSQCQSLAFSNDRGRTWTKYAGNPVLQSPEGLRDFRDPKVFWYSESGGGHWVMALAALNAIRFYISHDLIHWTPSGMFGETYGCQAGVWETPDLFQLPVDNEPVSRWVLTVGVGNGGPGGKSGMQYFVGHFDGKTFTSEYDENTTLWMDFGADYYAAQSWSDEPHGRRLMIGWHSNWQYARVVPTTTWRGVCSLPRELSLKRTESGIRLVQQPTVGIFAQRTEYIHLQDIVLAPGENRIEGMHGDVCEIRAEFKLNQRSTCFGVRVRVGESEETRIGYDVAQQKLFVDRTRAGQSSFDPGFAVVHSAHLVPENGAVHLHIFVDCSSLEVFGNNGQVVVADMIFPDALSQGIVLFSVGGETVLKNLEFYKMRPASFTMVER